MGKWEPAMTCNGVCKQYKAKKPRNDISRYAIGQRRCQSCCIFLWWDGLWCPCCSQRLRSVARGNVSRKTRPVIRA